MHKLRTLIDDLVMVTWAVVGVGVAAAVGALIGGLVGGFMGDGRSTPTTGLWLGGLLGAALVAIPLLILKLAPIRAKARASQAAEESRRLNLEREREQAVVANNQRRDFLVSQIVGNSSRAVSQFEAMPHLFSEADSSTASAVAFFNDGAFSPFWSAIEKAYSHLADYRSAAESIEQCAQKHPVLMTDLVSVGGDPTSLAEFPVSLDTNRVSQALQEATAGLSKIVYEAQRQPTFAQIWEQRRTTAAVITGFTSLEAAVNNMGSALSSSIHTLGSSLETANNRVGSVLETISSANSILVGVQKDQTQAMRDLTGKSIQIRGELYRQTWGSYPLFS